MNVRILRNETSQALLYEDAVNTYTKGGVYCVEFYNDDGDRTVHKYPLCTLFRIEESYE